MARRHGGAWWWRHWAGRGREVGHVAGAPTAGTLGRVESELGGHAAGSSLRLRPAGMLNLAALLWRRLLRKRWVLALVFGLSLVYFLSSTFKQVSDCARDLCPSDPSSPPSSLPPSHSSSSVLQPSSLPPSVLEVLTLPRTLDPLSPTILLCSSDAPPSSLPPCSPFDMQPFSPPSEPTILFLSVLGSFRTPPPLVLLPPIVWSPCPCSLLCIEGLKESQKGETSTPGPCTIPLC